MKLVRLLLLACICMMACRQQPQNNEVTNYDLPQMKDSGELVVLTLNSSTSYFNYRGEPMGFQYELARTVCPLAWCEAEDGNSQEHTRPGT